ncbi:GntR family transcriptional regulator [Actinocorallia longicatena]|uniref:HTH gntR-type domain-containing protein n=1 Tax=Actinocorallia longicatena TaxID=111803 RepID=A0ABP6Q860_9ACTN
MARRSVIDDVTETIAFQIASGAFQVGEHLPSIRQLAVRYEINPATVQQVLGRLRSAGFVEVHQGLGAVVRDVRLYGGIETWRYLFRFSGRLPGLAAQIVAEVLETKRLYVRLVLTSISENPGRYDLAPFDRAVRSFELLARGGDATPQDLHKATLHLLRTCMSITERGIGLGVLNSVGGMLGEVPEVLGVVYADPEAAAWWWRHLVTTASSGALDQDSIALLLTLLNDWDTEITLRLQDVLQEH